MVLKIHSDKTFIKLHLGFFLIILTIQCVEIFKFTLLYFRWGLYKEAEILYKQDPESTKNKITNFFLMPELYSVTNNTIFVFQDYM